MANVRADVAELLAAALALSLRFEKGSGTASRQKRLHDLLTDYQDGEEVLAVNPKIRCSECIDCHAETMRVLRKFKQ